MLCLIKCTKFTLRREPKFHAPPQAGSPAPLLSEPSLVDCCVFWPKTNEPAWRRSKRTSPASSAPTGRLQTPHRHRRRRQTRRSSQQKRQRTRAWLFLSCNLEQRRKNWLVNQNKDQSGLKTKATKTNSHSVATAKSNKLRWTQQRKKGRNANSATEKQNVAAQSCKLK